MGIGKEKKGARSFTSLDEPSRQYEASVRECESITSPVYPALYPEEGGWSFAIGIN